MHVYTNMRGTDTTYVIFRWMYIKYRLHIITDIINIMVIAIIHQRVCSPPSRLNVVVHNIMLMLCSMFLNNNQRAV